MEKGGGVYLFERSDSHTTENRYIVGSSEEFFVGA